MAETTATATQSVATIKENQVTEYLVNGQTIKLTANIVRNYLTKGNGAVTDQDIMQFIAICKFNSLNPFLNEAYLIKFGTQPAQMIVSKEALMKRAETSDQYDGMTAGVIVKTRDGEIKQLEGSFFDDDCTLVGGWAKVFRKDRKQPFIATVRLSEYDKKQSIWNTSKSTMIRKVAVTQAMREAFPTQLGAMYTAEEQKIEDVTATVVDLAPINADAAPANDTQAAISTAPAPETVSTPGPETAKVRTPGF